jgi:branched-chain amino acid transport system substrate-binding protein
MVKLKTFCAAAILAGLLWCSGGALAEQPLRIGVLNDMSGPYSDYQGRGSVVAAQMAVDDFGGKVKDRPIEVISGDHQNKPDVGSALARRWFDLDGVDAIFDVPNSAVALAVAQITREKNKAFIASGAGTAELTGARCSPNTVQWTYDTWEVGHALGQAVVARGGKKWYFLTADYAFGIDLEDSTGAAVREAGGTVLGSARAPLGTSDYSSFLVQAQSSGADVLGLANAGGDLTTSIKQAAEFGLTPAMKLAGPVVNINVVQGVGLADSKGLLSVTPFYWDMNDGTRAFSQRYQKLDPKHLMPNDMQAGVYAAVLDYLKAVAALGSASDGGAVIEEMKKRPTDDPLFGKGSIRPDGRALHPIYLMETKTPAESHGPWDFFKLVDTIPAEQAFRPLSQGGCPLVK